jgi:hypothetical protein
MCESYLRLIVKLIKNRLVTDDEALVLIENTRDKYLKLVIKLIKNRLVTDDESLVLIENIRKNFNSTKEWDENFWIPSEEINHPKTNKDIQTGQNILPKWLDKEMVWDKDTWTQKRNITTTPFNPWETTYPGIINISDFPPSFNVTCNGNSFHDEYKVPDKK